MPAGPLRGLVCPVESRPHPNLGFTESHQGLLAPGEMNMRMSTPTGLHSGLGWQRADAGHICQLACQGWYGHCQVPKMLGQLPSGTRDCRLLSHGWHSTERQQSGNLGEDQAYIRPLPLNDCTRSRPETQAFPVGQREHGQQHTPRTASGAWESRGATSTAH